MTAATPVQRSYLDAADEARHAAHAVVVEPVCAVHSAAPLFAASWRALAQAKHPDEAPADDAALTAWLDPGVVARLPESAQKKLQTQRPQILAEARRDVLAASTLQLSRRELEDHSVWLARGISLTRKHQGGGSSPVARRRWPARVLLVSIVAVLVLGVWRPWQAPTFGPWRGTYFTREDFTGDTHVRHAMRIRFDWAGNPPFDEIPANRFSVYFDTCLRLDAPTEAVFQLINMDSGRLYINGKRVVDNWGTKKLRSRATTRKLPAGTHHLRIEYRKKDRPGHVALQASLDGNPPTDLPLSQIAAPSGGIDDDDPCGVKG